MRHRLTQLDWILCASGAFVCLCLNINIKLNQQLHDVQLKFKLCLLCAVSRWRCTQRTCADCEWTEEYSSITCEFAMKITSTTNISPCCRNGCADGIFHVLDSAATKGCFFVAFHHHEIYRDIVKFGCFGSNVGYSSIFLLGSFYWLSKNCLWFDALCVLSPSHIKMHRTFLRLYINKVVEAFK